MAGFKILASHELRHTVGEPYIGKRFERQVDRHGNLQPGAAPAAAKCCSFSEHDPREFIDEIVVFEWPNECVGRDDPLLRAAPTCQRFGPLDSPGRQFDLGLKEGLELVVLQSCRDLLQCECRTRRLGTRPLRLCRPMELDQRFQLSRCDRFFDDAQQIDAVGLGHGRNGGEQLAFKRTGEND